MILFQDGFDEAQELIAQLEDKIELIRALGNFHIDAEFPAEYEDLVNQRRQILKFIRQLQDDFSQLTLAWKKNIEELQARTSYQPENDKHAELVTKFIKTAVPPSQHASWKHDFTGSLLVFFVDGDIESSSFIERDAPMEESEKTEATPPEAAGEIESEPEIEEDSLERLVQNIAEQEERHPRPQSKDAIEEAVRVVSEQPEALTIVRSTDIPGVNIYFHLDEPSRAIINIYDATHRVVRTIANDYDQPGDYSIQWDGCDDKAEALAFDTYYCQLVIGDSQSELKAFELR